MEGAWSFLRHFSYTAAAGPGFSASPRTTWTWGASLALTGARRDADAPLREWVKTQVAKWDQKFEKLDGDPLHEDWSRFRPLRLTREEDWSDWLAWLLEHSDTGRLAAELFRREPKHCIRPAVDRELIVAPYRLDLRIRWTRGADQAFDDMATVEVKVGDRNFEKASFAAARHRDVTGNVTCVDWTLLPSADFESCNDPDDRKITWDGVAIALRTCLTFPDPESLTWRVWARAFCGCIEQKILDLPRISALETSGNVGDLVTYLENVHAK